MKKYKQFVEDTFAAPMAANAVASGGVAAFDPILKKKKSIASLLTRQVLAKGIARRQKQAQSPS
jgi:hypothetical protein